MNALEILKAAPVGSIVTVIWADILLDPESEGCWVAPEQLEATVHGCSSVGFLAGVTDQAVTLVSSVSDLDLAFAPLHIPAGSIVEAEVLVEPEEGEPTEAQGQN